MYKAYERTQHEIKVSIILTIAKRLISFFHGNGYVSTKYELIEN